MEVEETQKLQAPVPAGTGQEEAGGSVVVEEKQAGEAAAPINEGDESTAEPITDPEPEDEGKKPPRGVQKRLDEITKEKYEWKREAEYWRDQAMSDRNGRRDEQLKDQQPKETALPTPTTAGKPDPDKYEDYNDYVEALTDWKTEQKFSKVREEAERKDKEAALHSEKQNLQAEFGKSVESAKSKHVDFDTTILSAKSSPCTPDMLGAMMSSPQGADVMYYLAKNPAESARIAGLSPISQIREIGRIESKLSTPITPPEPRRITQTGEPVKTVSGAGVSEKDPEKMGMEEYAEWRQSQARNY